MPLPPSPYLWRWASPTGTDWRHRGDQPAGYLAVPADLATTDSDLLTVDAGTVRLKTPTERRAAAAVAKLQAIDAHVDALIAQGFVYAGKTFSLSPRAERRIEAVATGRGRLAYPFRVQAADGSIHSLASGAEVLAWRDAAQDAAVAAHEAGMSRVALVWAALANPDPAAGLAAVEAIGVPW